MYKMSKELSAKYYQNKERIKKKLVKGIKIFPKKRKTKSINMVANEIKISQNMKNNRYLRKKYKKWKNIATSKIKVTDVFWVATVCKMFFR